MKSTTSKLFEAAPTALIAVISPLYALFAGIGFLVMADLFTGIWASLKTGVPITSERFGRTVVKSLVYLVAILAAHVAQTYVMADVPVLKVISGIIGSTELLSLYENLTRISGIDFKRRLIEMIKPTRTQEREIDPPVDEP